MDMTIHDTLENRDKMCLNFFPDIVTECLIRELPEVHMACGEYKFIFELSGSCEYISSV